MQCNKYCNKHNPRKIDKCILNITSILKLSGYKVIASCCGHGIYPISIIIHNQIGQYNIELISGILIKRKKRFYKKDKQGMYYIPETIQKQT